MKFHIEHPNLIQLTCTSCFAQSNDKRFICSVGPLPPLHPKAMGPSKALSGFMAQGNECWTEHSSL